MWTDNSNINFLDAFNALPHDFPALFDSNGSGLTRDVSLDEVCVALQELPSGKSPGLDGFNVEFYRFF